MNERKQTIVLKEIHTNHVDKKCQGGNNKMAEHMKKQSNYYCDVLIIGGGSAGLRAAIGAHDAAANVIIISRSKRGDPHTIITWQVKSSLVACEAIIRSALMRQESRGAHYRYDFPKLDDEGFKINIYCTKKGKWVSAASAEMVLYKQNVKEIKEILSDMLKVYVNAAHKREFE